MAQGEGHALFSLIMARLSCIGVEVTSCRLDVLPLLPDPVGEAAGEEDPGQLDESHTNGHS
jgi:hypothetical protein